MELNTQYTIFGQLLVQVPKLVVVWREFIHWVWHIWQKAASQRMQIILFRLRKIKYLHMAELATLIQPKNRKLPSM